MYSQAIARTAVCRRARAPRRRTRVGSAIRNVRLHSKRRRSLGRGRDAEGAEADVFIISASARDHADVARVHGCSGRRTSRNADGHENGHRFESVRRDVVTEKCLHEKRRKATKNSKWASLSRAKLDVVEDLMLHGVGPVVWIDLDTLVFVDLARAFQRGASTWLVGYQRGMQCNGLKSCVGSHFRSVRPEFDVLGDLWSLDLAAIEKVRDYERRWVSSRWVRKPPKYDLQAYFSLMLENGVLAENVLLHNILPDLNFGFTCSNFEHPTSTNMEISVDSDDAQRLRCPIPKGVKMSPRVGTLSFTAWSFQKMFLDEEKPTFDSLSDDQDVRAWFARWFYSPL